MADTQADPYKGTAERLLARKEAEMDRTKQLLEATKSDIKSLYRQMLKDQEIKNAVTQEMISGVRGETGVSQVLNKLLNKTGGDGELRGDALERFNNIDNCPTGMEDRYWERE